MSSQPIYGVETLQVPVRPQPYAIKLQNGRPARLVKGRNVSGQ
jgi:hypothetical protein